MTEKQDKKISSRRSLKGGESMENKKKFIEELGVLLMMYSREEVEKFEYIREDFEELVCITYTNGYKKYVNIFGDSCIAVMSDVYKAMR